MFVNIPASVRTALCINCHYHTLAAELLSRLADQLRPVDCRRIDRDLICSLSQKPFKIIHSTDSSAHCKGDKHISGHIPYHIHNSIPCFTGSGYVKKNNLIRAGSIVCSGNFHRVTGVLQIHKVHAFYHTAFIHIQTGNNSLCKHLTHLPKLCKVVKNPQAKAAAFFRMELAGKYVILLNRSMNTGTVLCHCFHD